MEIDIVYNEDVISGMAKIPDASVDLIVTDPPYLINYQTKRRLDKDHRFSKPILNDNNVNLIEEYIKECFRISKNNTALYMFCSSKTIDTFLSLLRGGGTPSKILLCGIRAHIPPGIYKRNSVNDTSF